MEIAASNIGTGGRTRCVADSMGDCENRLCFGVKEAGYKATLKSHTGLEFRMEQSTKTEVALSRQKRQDGLAKGKTREGP